MFKKIMLHIVYGIKIVLLFALVINLVFLGACVVEEFQVKVTSKEVVLGEQVSSRDPYHFLSFKAEIDGVEQIIDTKNFDHVSGDTVEVIFRDGRLSHVKEPYDKHDYTSVSYRLFHTLYACGGIYVAIEIIVFIFAAIATKNTRKEVISGYPMFRTASLVIGVLYVDAVLSILYVCAVNPKADHYDSMTCIYIALLIKAGWALAMLSAYICKSIVYNLRHSRSASAGNA